MKTLRATAAAILIGAAGAGAGPTLINYQGRLLSAGGVPANTNIAVQVRLYDGAAGAQIFQETVGTVAVQNGMYSFSFGTNADALSSALTNTEVWLGLQVGAEELSPRQHLLCVPYALWADRVPNVYIATNAEETTYAGFDAHVEGYQCSTAFGYQPFAANYGSAFGDGASAVNFGTAMGYFSHADGYGLCVGANGNGDDSGVAVGYWAQGSEGGVSVGYYATATNSGVAVGCQAQGSQGNVALGAYTETLLGSNRTAVGYAVTNELDNTTVVRGNLYLDGADGIFTRPTFGTGGTGAWHRVAGGWSGNVTNLFGGVTQVLYYASGVLTNVVRR